MGQDEYMGLGQSTLGHGEYMGAMRVHGGRGVHGCNESTWRQGEYMGTGRVHGSRESTWGQGSSIWGRGE